MCGVGDPSRGPFVCQRPGEISPLAIARLERIRSGFDEIRQFPCAADRTRIRKIETLNQSDTTVAQAKIRSHRVDGLNARNLNPWRGRWHRLDCLRRG